MQIYKAPSGLGGSFDVVIVGDLPANRVRVRVHCPAKFKGGVIVPAPHDFHGFEYAVDRSALVPLASAQS